MTRTALLAALMLVSPPVAHALQLGFGRPTAVGEIAGRELPDWRQAGTGAANLLDQVCGGLVFEATLSGDSQRNYLNLSADNPTSWPVTLSMDDVMVQFSSGRVRRLLPGSEGRLEIQPHKVISSYLSFPDKTDFGGQEWMTVEVRVSVHEGPCTFELRFRRDPQARERAATSTRYRQWEFGVALGPSFAPHGAIAQVTPSVAWHGDFNVAVFPWPSHGFTFDFVLHGWGGDAAHKAVPGVTGNNLELDDFGFLAGYAFRTYPSSWLTVSLEAAAGIAWTQIGGDNSVHARSDVHGEAQGRARLLVPFATIYYGGLVATYTRFLGGHVGPTDISGGDVSAIAAIGMGY
jgi:hypothetical protein